MLRLVLVLVSTLLLVGGGSAAQAHLGAAARKEASSASCAGAVNWQSARRVIGTTATIKGPVAGTKYAYASNGSPTFLNIGADYPSPRRFTVVIWIENRAKFGRPEKRYLGRTICVRGLVETYRSIPEIEATSPSQIVVAG